MKSITQQIVEILYEESERIRYGKVFVEVTVHNGEMTNIQCETKRSQRLDKEGEA